MLDFEELAELEDALKAELDENLTGILAQLNRNNQLADLLHLLGMEHLLTPNSKYWVHKTGKILIIGQSSAKKSDLTAIAEKVGLERQRLEFHLDYKDAKTFNFRKLQWDNTYSVILVGPMGHSGTAKGDHSSVIAALESEDGYPPVVRLGSNGLKITKSNFRTKLNELLESGMVA